MYEHGDVFGGDGDSVGATGRVGLSLDYGFGKGFYLGIAVDGETFASTARMAARTSRSATSTP
jgi:hypothetical protein